MMLFLKYVSDKAEAHADSLIEVPGGCSFDDIAALYPSWVTGTPAEFRPARAFLVNVPAAKAMALGEPISVPDPSVGEILALWRRCPHLGCMVPELCESRSRFECRCHGSTYTILGEKLEKGPASRGMDRFAVELDPDVAKISANYFGEVVGMKDHIEQDQLHKIGLRYFFPAGDNTDIAQIQVARGAVGICCQKVSEAAVFGEGRRYLVALLEMDYETVAEWARERGGSGDLRQAEPDGLSGFGADLGAYPDTAAVALAGRMPQWPGRGPGRVADGDRGERIHLLLRPDAWGAPGGGISSAGFMGQVGIWVHPRRLTDRTGCPQ